VKLRILLPLTALALALGAAGLAVELARTALSPVDIANTAVRTFVVAPGEPLGSIATRLESEGLVRNAFAFKALARWREQESALQVGEYSLSPALEAAAILATIAEGRVVTYEVAIPEGFTLTQIAERIALAGLAEEGAFLAVARSPETAAKFGVEGQTLEGYLFPETYRMPRGLSAEEVAAVLVNHFLAVWRELEPAARTAGLSMRELVTLASIIEKETGAPQERPLIASVFLNRMARGMRLETDPTVIYGIPNFDGNIRRRHLEDASNPYNTYVIPGLPPGPIASPGRAALEAVLDPTASEYLFFVSRNDGTHVFSKTYREHVTAVNRYQKR
jgi:UPF0755 protein